MISPTLQQALDLLDQTEDQGTIDAGFEMLREMADNGDMTAAAHLGYAYQFRHLGHYNLDLCREYLEKAVAADDPVGQFFLGSMLMTGDAPFKEDKVYGKWLLEEAKKGGVEDAGKLLDCLYMEMSTADAKRMLGESGRKLFFLNLWEAINNYKNRI